MFSFPAEGFYDQLEPATAALEECKTAALASNWKEAGHALLDHFHDRLRPQTFLHGSDLEGLRHAFRGFPEECRAWVRAADAALAHRFAPLRGEETPFGHSIDWYTDFRGGSWMQAPVSALRETLKLRPPDADGQESLARSLSFNGHAHLLDLVRAAWLTGNQAYASEAIVQAVDWADRNPLGFGIAWLHPRVVALRTLHWIMLVQHLLASDLLSGEVLGRLLRSLLLHGAALARQLREEEGGGTRLSCAAALHLLCGFLPEMQPCKKWDALARQHLGLALRQDFGSDGFHASGLLSLHREALDWLLLCGLQEALNSRHLEGLSEFGGMALEALLYARPGPGQPGEVGPAVSEGVLGRNASPGEHAQRLLLLGSTLLGRPDLHPTGSDTSAELLWWLGPDAHANLKTAERTEPRGSRRLFSGAALATVREGWGLRSSWCSLRGPQSHMDRQGAGRYCEPEPQALPQHDDALSLALTLEGEPVLLEPGMPLAGGEASRSFARLVAHSAVRIGREVEPLSAAPEVEIAPPTLESCRDGHYLMARRPVWIDLDQPMSLTREVLFLPKKQRIVIRDTLHGEGEVHFESNLLLAPHLDMLMRGDMGSLLRGRKLQARILPLFPGRFRYEVLKGRTNGLHGFFWSEAGRAVPTNLLRYFARVQAPAVVSLWIAWNPEDTLSPRPQDVEKLFRTR